MKSLVVYLLLVSLPLTGWAQKNKIVGGVLSFQESNYPDAIIAFNEGLQDPSLNAKHIAKGASYLGRSYMAMYNNRKSDAQQLAELWVNYPSFPTAAWDAFLKAEENDQNESYVKQNKAFYPLVAEASYLKALDLYREKKYEEALPHAQTGAKVVEEANLISQYVAFNILGYVLVELKQAEKAAEAFQQAIAFYNKAHDPSQEPDPNIESSYTYLVEVYLIDLKDDELALKYIQEGRETFPDNDNLKRLELQFYQTHPDYREEALAKFKQAAAENPEDIGIIIGYGMLLQGDSTTIPQAIEQYQNAIKIDPSNFLANFNLGALYIEEWRQLNKRYQNIDDEAESNRIQQRQEEVIALAYERMQAAYNAKPTDKQVVQALYEITLVMGNEDEAAQYEAQLDAMD